MRFFAALVLAAPLYAQCSYILDKSTVNVPATATTANTINVTVIPATCRWLPNVTSGAWLHLTATSQQVMTGSGSFTFSADANPLGVSRSGTITISTENTALTFVTVTQDSAVCN